MIVWISCDQRLPGNIFLKALPRSLKNQPWIVNSARRPTQGKTSIIRIASHSVRSLCLFCLGRRGPFRAWLSSCPALVWNPFFESSYRSIGYLADFHLTSTGKLSSKTVDYQFLTRLRLAALPLKHSIIFLFLFCLLTSGISDSRRGN